MTPAAAKAPGLAVGAQPLTAAAIAATAGGTLEGDPGMIVHAVAPLDRAEAGQLSFCGSAAWMPALATTRASVVLVTPALATAPCPAPARIVVPHPMDALIEILPVLYRPAPRLVGVHPTVIIGRGARIGADVALGPYVVIGAGAIVGDRAWIGAGCVIGDGVPMGVDVRLHPGVTLYTGTELGDRVEVHSGTRLGSDGFGYVPRGGGHRKIPHVGRCLIGDDVEIGANTAIDRGSISDTVIGSGTKIDNLVHIAHNCRIGRFCLLMATVAMAGSTIIEDGVAMAGQSGASGQLTIGAGARIGGGGKVFGDVPPGETWTGYPARPHREFLRAQAALYRLAGLAKDLERLVRKPS